ncbi:4-(cytidine 5'-diphospho)-2-C-methyl-D-erythritol kinase [Syntrophomonas palmitatica]|uniref:4-(cytidine 5'-diphospho)-2-C-methyl-D-erythritol kinase n=1 Tax=Syntrophomonas palmitatica TaxID=402877 RepID=UPI0006D23824|nr:4-(cytidine 5'-diphospho)-2-C-methyl-D-erythritol kinase [Syntrophomonas palmitatica]
MEKFGQKAGVKIFIEKNIPVAAGLAGGSTDAAAVLMGINELYALAVPQEELMRLGLTLGSDIPYCLAGSPLREKDSRIMAPAGVTCLARGRGEILSPLPSVCLQEILIVKPDFQLSTAEVYGGYRDNEVTDRPDIELFLQAWRQHDLRAVAARLGNVLESVSIKKQPQIEMIKNQLGDLGAINALMSGSGPSVFGLFADGEKARHAFNILKQRYKETYLVSSY